MGLDKTNISIHFTRQAFKYGNQLIIKLLCFHGVNAWFTEPIFRPTVINLIWKSTGLVSFHVNLNHFEVFSEPSEPKCTNICSKNIRFIPLCVPFWSYLVLFDKTVHLQVFSVIHKHLVGNSINSLTSILIYIIKWNFLYFCLSVCLSVPKYLEKYRTYSVKTNT